MTETEKQQIISLVLQALKTNSLTIEQLTSITELPDDAYIEVSGGCKISCGDLKKVFQSYLPGVDIVCSYGDRVDAVICQAFFTKEVKRLDDNDTLFEKELKKLWERDVFLSESEYESLPEKDDTKLYFTYEDE